MKRLFYALKIPASYMIKEALTTFQQALYDEKINWVDPEHMHLTLKFFGDTPPHRIRDIIHAARSASGDSKAFRLHLEGCGTFGPPKEPRVIWIGAQTPDALTGLYRELHKCLKPFGYEPDKQTFSPHITLGRIKKLSGPDQLKQMLMVYKNSSFGSYEINAFGLYESILHPDGPEYKVVEEFELM